MTINVYDLAFFLVGCFVGFYATRTNNPLLYVVVCTIAYTLGSVLGNLLARRVDRSE